MKNPRARRYDEKTKKSVAQLIAKGRMTVYGAMKEYEIGGAETIRGWLRKYAPDYASARLAVARTSGARTAGARTAGARKGGAKKMGKATGTRARKVGMKKSPGRKGTARKAMAKSGRGKR